MKRGFETITGSQYFLDTDKKELTGGNLRHPVRYTGTPVIMTGGPAYFALPDGRAYRTSTVTRYIREGAASCQSAAIRQQ